MFQKPGAVKRDGLIPGSDKGQIVWKKIEGFAGAIDTSRFENGFWNGLLEENA